MTNGIKISFMRHGHVHNPEEVFYGCSEGFPLSEEGRLQAQAAREILCNQPIAAIFSSPLLRARQTAEIIKEPHKNLSITISDLIKEVYTPFDGQPLSKLTARNWDIYTGVGPEYEQPVNVFNRTNQLIQHLRDQYAGQHVVVVTHGDVIAFLMVWIRGLPLTPQSKEGLYKSFLATASISTFTYHTEDKDEIPDFEYINPRP